MELDRINSTPPASIPNQGLDTLEKETQVIQAAAQVVPALIDGGMAPAPYLPSFQPTKGAKPQGRDQAIAKGIAAAVFGASLGFGVTQSLQNVFVVHGQPTIYARTAVSLLLNAGHEIWTGEESPESVTVYGRRRGSDQVESSTWTIQRAEQAGFTSNSKYRSQPTEMLYAKAAMAVCRRVAPDVLSGLPYAAEEMILERPPVQAKAQRIDRGAGGLAAALGAPKPAQEPDPEPTPPAPAQQVQEPDPAIAQLATTLASFTTPEQVQEFVEELKKQPGVPDEAIELGRKRWNELKTA